MSEDPLSFGEQPDRDAAEAGRAECSVQIKQSEINKAIEGIAVDACGLLRKWSDSDGMIGPSRIGEFQESLKQMIAEVYFGTHDRLRKLDGGIE